MGGRQRPRDEVEERNRKTENRLFYTVALSFPFIRLPRLQELFSLIVSSQREDLFGDEENDVADASYAPLVKIAPNKLLADFLRSIS
jgi:hypothetical protein